MPKPRPISPDAQSPGNGPDPSLVGSAEIIMDWLAATATTVLPGDPLALADGPLDILLLADPEEAMEPDGFGPSGAGGSAAADELGQFSAGTWLDGFGIEASALPEWHVLMTSGNLHSADLFLDAPDRSEVVSQYAAKGMQDSFASDLILLDFASIASSERAEPRGGNGKRGGKGGGDSNDPSTLSDYLSGDPDGYNIQIDFKGAWTSALQDAFVDASELISDLILGDVTDVFFRGKVIDDIKITADLQQIDGTGGILGQAGPTAIRTADYLPATGVMQFDAADAQTFFDLGLWDEIVLHEMLHTVGFGSIWNYLGLVADSGTLNPTFTGANATLAYQSLFDAEDAVGVPLEQDGGAGTAESHWDEEIFDTEIMTGFLDASGNYLSDVTVASLADLGYDTSYAAPLV